MAHPYERTGTPVIARAVYAKHPFHPDIGDVYWSRGSKFLAATEPVQGVEAKERDIPMDVARGRLGGEYPLAILGQRLLNTPARLGIDISEVIEESRYTCPYSGREHFALCPVSLLTKDPSPYRVMPLESWRADVFFNPMEMFTSKRKKISEMLTSVGLVDLGPGYIAECDANDGSAGLRPCLIDLDNGDHLLVVSSVWFNK